jgi:hypothetical protein
MLSYRSGKQAHGEGNISCPEVSSRQGFGVVTYVVVEPPHKAFIMHLLKNATSREVYSWRKGAGRRTILPMTKRTKWLLACLISVAAVAVTCVPYLLANRIAQPEIFTGFLLNPADGFSYIAKMRQGADGSWLFQLPYAPEPGSSTMIFTYHLFLGHVSDWSGLPLLSTYHVARILVSILFFVMTFAFFDHVFDGRRIKWFAFVITIIGSGLGWLGLLFGIQASDLMIPESIPFLMAYTNAHFPLAGVALLGAVLAVIIDRELRLRTLGAFLCGLVLGMVMPFAMISLTAVLFAWFVWEIIREGSPRNLLAIWRNHRNRFIPFLGLMFGAGPWLLYYAWLAVKHPVISLWTTQNLTPSPPLLNYVLGYGLILLLAIVGVVKTDLIRKPSGRLFITWLIVNGLLLYAPFNLQRRLTLGLFFPLAAMAAYSLENWMSEHRLRRVVLLLAILLSIPSNLVVMGAGLAGVSQRQTIMLHTEAELKAYEWLSTYAHPNSMVLAAPETGNRLPAFADIRVLYGHPFETPNAVEQEEKVLALYNWVGSVEDGLELLTEYEVDFVVYGRAERNLGEPSWLGLLPVVFQFKEVEIYEVRSP